MGRSSWQVLVLVSIVTALIAVCWQLVQLRQKIEVDSGARFGIYDVLVEKENGMGLIQAIVRHWNQMKNYVDINILT